jgi:AraC-like DNA-binding protein
MKTFNLLPHPALRPYVDRIWGWEGDAHETVPLPTLLPGTGAELYCHYRTPFAIDGDAQPLPDGHLFCVRGAPVRLLPSAALGFIAVRFRTGMLGRFVRVPTHELIDTRRSLDELWGAAGAGLLRALSAAPDHGARVALVQTFLARHCQAESRDPLVERGMAMLYRRHATLSVDALAAELGLGRRQLERRWTAFSGQSPGASRHLCRFQHTVRAWMLDPSTPAAAHALDHGYYDQAHFIHDFRRRVGQSPVQYLRGARAKTHFYNTPLRPRGMLTAPEPSS